ncbi:hypothetical protein AXG93_977s1330 [Marchantia polymorpha subsp. ruderalis]|uniref:Uncharacterized protein n=1 Tax=Marchantia polymorpha subsp. ruderalis TaxID=1480154 RepID=A0A176WBM3_MARPO|nr:hypothetical protein AXG93_977s1330 [Marchantia polymorpha subsp. ruderalis]
MRTSVPPTHRRFPADRRPLADVDLCLRVGRESSPTHRRPPTSRQDSPPVQRRKGKEPAEDPPSGQGPSGPDPPAYNAPRFAPSGHRVFSRERAETAPSAGNPPADAPSAVGPSGQAGSSEAAGVPSAAAPADHSQPHSGQSPTQSMATEILPSDDDEGGSTEAMSGSGDTEEEEEEIVGAPTAALCEQVVHTSKLLARVDRELKELREQYDCLWGQYNLVRKSHAYNELKKERLEELTKDVVRTTEELISKKT